MSKILKSFGMAALLVALLAGTGAAATTDDTALTGEVPLIYSITAPASVDFGTFDEGPNTKTTDGTTIEHVVVATNGNLDLQAHESGATGDATNDGFMQIGTTATKLGAKMTIKAGANDAKDLGVPATPAVIAEDVSSGSVTITFGQGVSSSDTQGNYGITVTFSAIAATP